MMTDEELKVAKEAIERGKPRPFDLDDSVDLRRLYREASGYLKVCHLKHGTDWEGRKFAIDALDALARTIPRFKIVSPPGYAGTDETFKTMVDAYKWIELKYSDPKDRANFKVKMDD